MEAAILLSNPKAFSVMKRSGTVMNGAGNSLYHVLKRFPTHWARIRSLAESDEGFDELCRDYAAALEARAHWQARSDAAAAERAQHYAEIVAELEAEISSELNASDRLTQR